MTEQIFIGVDVGGTSLRAARFVGHTSTPEKKIKTATQPAGAAEQMLDRLEAVIREVAPPALAGVAGIGVGIPGPVNPFTGVVINITNIPGWKNLNLKQLLEARLNVPIYLGNDGNLAALGEWKFGAGQNHRDVLYLTISTGIGGGVVLNNKLLLGAHGLATEVGHVLIQPDGPLCGCGQRGCLEAFASGPSIAREAQRRLRAGEGAESSLRQLGEVALTTVQIGQAALSGDAFAQGLFKQAGEHIGFGLASLLHLFNPSIVVIGGGVSFVGDILFEPIRQTVRHHVMNEIYWRDVPIVPAALGDDAGLVGAGALAMEESLARVLPDR